MDSIITTIAILLANWDDHRDYLANFEPFAVDCLKGWPPDEPVRSKRLAAMIAESFHLPPIPLNTVTLLRDRLAGDGYLRRSSDNRWLPDPVRLATVDALRPRKVDVLAAYHAVKQGATAYALEHHGLRWTEDEAELVIEKFLEEFSVEMAVAKRRGGMPSAKLPDKDGALTAMHAFARDAITNDRAMSESLEVVVRGSMLANVIYYSDLGTWTPRLDRLVVYLDTTVAIRALGLAPAESAAAAKEMVAMLRAMGRPIRVFDHTVDEMLGVLESVMRGLRAARRGSLDLVFMTREHREVIDHLVHQGLSAGDVEAMIVDLEARLNRMGIRAEPVASRRRETRLDERRLAKTLQAYGWRREASRWRDVQSLVGVHRLRAGRTFRELGDAPALFVTSNERLAAASDAFFEELGLAGKVPHCMTDVSLTTQLWLRQRQRRPDVPRKVLIAESWAALNLTPELWERFADQLTRQHEEGALDERQVWALAFTVEAREELARATNGDPAAVDENTPAEVLTGYERRVTEPHRRRADDAARDADDARHESYNLDKSIRWQAQRFKEQRDELRELTRQVAELSDWKERRQQTDIVVRQAVAGAGVIVAVSVGGVLAVPLGVDDAWVLAIVVTVAVVVASALVAWGWRGGWKLAGSAFAVLAGLIGLLVGVYSAFPDDDSGERAPTVTHTSPTAGS